MDITYAILELNDLRTKACLNGFELKPFQGFVLIETETGCELHFENAKDVETYIDACDLSEVELRKHYGFPTDSEITE